MPISKFGLWRLLAASGLFMLATFSAGQAQEPPVDPNRQDVPLPEESTEGFHAVSPLAQPENDYENCGPAPAAWHPPIYYPSPEAYCPTGNVHRDWWREMTAGFTASRRQRMLEKDYAWRVQNGHQPTCCPPHSSWGHSCDQCPGEGCRSDCNILRASHAESAKPCGIGCGINPGCQSFGDETSSADPQETGILLTEGESETDEAESGQADGEQTDGIQLASDEHNAADGRGQVESAGYCEVSDGCAPSHCQPRSRGGYHSHGRWCDRHHCPLHGRHGHGGWGRWHDDCWDDDCDDDWDDNGCGCPVCCWKRFCRCLYTDGPGAGGWRREIHPLGHYDMAYPVNPYHFDKRDGRIYAAQGYGHPVGVPLAPNVEHTYNYGWGVPSSRLSPVSRMPGAPGVANPAVPGAAGPGIFPPAYPGPISGGFGR